jgi:S1-C subfamily serine protease
VVTSVRPNTPGAEAGLRAGTFEHHVLGTKFIRGGDVIVGIAGHPVGDAADVVRVVTNELSPGQSVTLTYVRGGERRQVRVTLARRPPNPGEG